MYFDATHCKKEKHHDYFADVKIHIHSAADIGGAGWIHHFGKGQHPRSIDVGVKQYGISLMTGSYEDGSVASITLFFLGEWRNATNLAILVKDIFRLAGEKDDSDFGSKTSVRLFELMFEMQWHEAHQEWVEVLEYNGLMFHPHKGKPIVGWYSLDAFDDWLSDDPAENCWSFSEDATKDRNGEVSSEIFHYIDLEQK